MLKSLGSRIKKGIRKSSTYLTPNSNSEILVLLYHRVIDLSLDSQLLAVSPANFDSQLHYLVKNYNVINYDELIASFKNNKFPPRTVCITFDDGYVDNLEIAKPLLEKYQVPGLFFISTGNIGKNREFWWDELEQYFLCNRELPDKLSVKKSNSKIDFILGDWQTLDEQKTLELRNWNVTQASNDNPRLEAFLSCLKLFKLSDIEQRELYFNQLWEQSSLSAQCRDRYRVMSEAELIEFSDSPLIRIGAHTVNHCSLSSLAPQRIKKEILSSKKDLAKILRDEPITFSYPFGYTADYGSIATKTVRESNFESAFSVNSQRFDRNSHIYEIPRFQVPNIPDKEFGNWLHSIYH